MNETRLTFGKRLDWTASALVSLQLQFPAPFLTCNRYKIVSFCAATRYTLDIAIFRVLSFWFLLVGSSFFFYCFCIFMSLPPTKSRRKSPVQCNFACNSLWCHKLLPLKWNFNCCCRIVIIIVIIIIIASQEARRARIERLTCTFPTASSGMGLSYFIILFFSREKCLKNTYKELQI